MGTNVWAKSGTVRNMFPDGGPNDNDAAPPTGATTGVWIYRDSPSSTYQGVVNGTGTVGCTITIQYSNDGVNALATAGGTITLSGTTVASDGFTTTGAPWKWHRAVISAPSGTITSIYCYHGV